MTERRKREWIPLPPAPAHVQKVLREVYELRGFIVIGQPPDTPSDMRVGMKTRQVFQFDMGAHFRLVETATHDHWIAQAQLISELRPEWKFATKQSLADIGGRYFKVIPAKKPTRLAA
jgi:hypothetical protein